MGKETESSMSIGIAVRVSDIIEHINEHNFEAIKNIIFDTEIRSFLDGEDDECYDIFYGIFGNMDDEIKNDWEKYKEYLTRMLKTNGGDCDDSKDIMYDLTMLVPMHRILNVSQYGYDTEGMVGTFVPIQQVNIEELQNKIKKTMEDICFDKYTIAYILRQYAG